MMKNYTFSSGEDVADTMIEMANTSKSVILASFFKTGKGEYAEGDKFLGITVPLTRKIVKDTAPLPPLEIENLIASPWHEVRLAGLLILVKQFQASKTLEEKRDYMLLYLSLTEYINNWDLVDTSAAYILGDFLYTYEKENAQKLLTSLSHSPSLWERRIAMISTHFFIKKKEPALAQLIMTELLSAPEDLLHKACGWMLREIGVHCGKEHIESFLEKNRTKMPRTMLRYAIEHFPEQERKAILALPHS